MSADQISRLTYDPSSRQPGRVNIANISTKLVWVSDKDVSRKLIKSHVAKGTHAKVRRRCVIEYQNQQRRERASATPLEIPSNIVPSPHRDVGYHLGAPISQFELFLVNHYIHTIVNHTGERSHTYYPAAMRDWIPTAIGDRGMRMGLFLCACRSLYFRTGLSRYDRCALQYKAICLSILSDAVRVMLDVTETRSVRDATISTALQLASDGFATGDSMEWKSHTSAISQMVRHNGGLDKVTGMNGFLRKMVEAMIAKHERTPSNSELNKEDVVGLYTMEYFFSHLT